jgi:quinol monooxygenase YgiN
MASAPPFVAYSSLTEAVVPEADWPALYASLQALKGHVQEYPGCQRFDVFVRAELEGAVRVHCYTTWDSPAQLEVFLERGYTFERLLADVGPHLSAERSLAMEKVF